ncbi:right-handed parallel beta-helix repeat-containing protein [Neobacillus cucumis]|uniref:right-handed parallel beta-helix repeat-containing protein n=1 Tax=Neobacillus cucumis TaxID=1740721 RepID=UPI00203AC906|nr:right-handed parallel beta-helix repeat-containing protein [Neobacillus cucumis]MCM3729109.1 right-handed parallel beta-helix repeat-containing protein [Neobacillus cucumis]
MTKSRILTYVLAIITIASLVVLIRYHNANHIETQSEFISSLTTGKNVTLKNGTYTLTADITKISNSVTIQGHNNSIIDGGKHKISVSNLNDVTFRNITFKNFSQIDLPSSANIKFENCTFIDFIDFGITLSNFNNVQFIESKIHNIGSSSKNPTYQGSGIYANVGNKLIVQDCEISHTYGHGGVFLIKVTNIHINRNKIHDTAFRGINFYGGISTGLIDDNDIWNCGSINQTNSGVGANGIYSAGSTYDVTVSNNRISNVLENGIEGLYHIIEGNIINGTGLDTINHPTPSIEGIYPFQPRDSNQIVIVRKNKIKNTKGAGIKYYSSRAISNYKIVDNIISDNRYNENNGIDLNSDHSYANISVIGNKVKNKATVIYLRNKPSSNIVVDKNKLVN